MKLMLILLQLTAGGALAHEHKAVNKDSDGYKQFEKLSAVLGHWTAKAEGRDYKVWYKLIAGGSSLMETEKFEGEPEMITVYFLDNDKLVMTHYCSANNQPHMAALPSSKDGKRFEFAYQNATNLADPAMGHMSHLVVTLEDADHLVQDWTWTEGGKDVHHQFQLARDGGALPKAKR